MAETSQALLRTRGGSFEGKSVTMMTRKTVPACFFSCVLILALTCCGGASSQKQKEAGKEKMVGGCSIDTIQIGLAIPNVPGSTGTGRIELRSLEDRGADAVFHQRRTIPAEWMGL